VHQLNSQSGGPKKLEAVNSSKNCARDKFASRS
jgi:hypothetical protein